MVKGRKLRSVAMNLLLVLASLAISAVVLEIALRMMGPARSDWFAAGPGRAAFLQAHVQRNPQGFRDDPFAPAGAPGRRIVALGDSFTFGDGIERHQDTWPEQLAELARRSGAEIEVDNLGIPGTNTESQRRVLREHGLPLRPERVIVGFVLNDPEPPLANRTAIPQRVFRPLVPGPWDAALTRRSFLYAWLRAKKNQVMERMGVKETYADYVESLYRPGPDWDRFVDQAGGLVRDARSAGAEVTVVLFPLFMEGDQAGRFDAATRQAASVFEAAGADVVDLRPAFDGVPTDQLRVSPDDAHPNERAHALVAAHLAAHLGLAASALPASGRGAQEQLVH